MELFNSTECIYQYEINNITEDHAQKAFGKKDYSPTLRSLRLDVIDW